VAVVRVDVLVTDSQGPVTGLRGEDFEVRDNGVLQQVEFASFENLPLSVMLALDVSGSVSGERLTHLGTAATSVTEALQSADRAGLLTFSSAVALPAPLTGDVGKIRTALDSLSTGGDTALVDASYSAMVLSEAEGGRPLTILFSDGADTASFLRPDDVLATARRSDAVVYAVAVGGAERGSFLANLTAQTGGRVLVIRSTPELGATFISILDEFRQRYVISYSPRGVPQAGWHPVDVRVKGRRVNVTARRGYIVSP
jgi:VWFA-related protein